MDTLKTVWPNEGAQKSALVNLTPYQLPVVLRGRPYNVELAASGGKGPLEWKIVDGSLPSGFQLKANRIVCETVQERMHAVLTVRVKDAEGMTSDAQTLLSCEDPDDIIASVRQRGAFLVSAVMLVIAGGGALLAGKILISLEEYVFTEAMRLRTVVGIAAPIGRPDWYAIAVLCVVPLFVVILLGAVLQWHRRGVLRKARAMWGGSSRERQELARIDSVPEQCASGIACPHCERKQQYLKRLAGSRRWEGSPLAVKEEERYVPLANSVFAELRKEIAERALTCGLLVGVGQNRWFDALTIAISSFEMQMFVLGSLGKRPGLRTWWRLLRSSAASLFINAYLNRQDVFLLNLLIRQSAWGLHAAAGASDYAAMHMRESLQHHVDHVSAVHDSGVHFNASDLDLDELHQGMNGVLKLGAEVAAFSFSTGAVALNQIAAFVEHHSAAMVQGALAGGILYWHGCDLAADILAIDQKHRQSAELRVSVFSCAQESAKSAGLILQTATRGMRSVYRQRRMRIVKNIFGRRTWGQFLRSKG